MAFRHCSAPFLLPFCQRTQLLSGLFNPPQSRVDVSSFWDQNFDLPYAVAEVGPVEIHAHPLGFQNKGPAHCRKLCKAHQLKPLQPSVLFLQARPPPAILPTFHDLFHLPLNFRQIGDLFIARTQFSLYAALRRPSRRSWALQLPASFTLPQPHVSQSQVKLGAVKVLVAKLARGAADRCGRDTGEGMKRCTNPRPTMVRWRGRLSSRASSLLQDFQGIGTAQKFSLHFHAHLKGQDNSKREGDKRGRGYRGNRDCNLLEDNKIQMRDVWNYEETCI